MPEPAPHTYCTIVAQNYLPQALALYQSVRTHEPDVDLVLLVIDADRADLMEGRPGLRVVTWRDLGMTKEEFDRLAAIYDVVELSTAVKPRLLRELLHESQYVAYLDPDMYLVAPLSELGPALAENPVQLTPHFLHPIPPGSSYISEVHSLTVGIHNLGFCAVGRGAEQFLDWWWSHLERECLIYPLLGLFVDQKWTDIGANLFDARSLRHAGYNVGPWNLLEREIRETDAGYVVGVENHPLRLLHFSGFDPNDPEAVSVRLNSDLRGKATQSAAYLKLSRQYADVQLAAKQQLGALPSYRYNVDSSGKPISRRLRNAYRADLLVSESKGATLPSAFDAAEAEEFSRWRRKARRKKTRLALGDAAIAAKYAFPDTFAKFKKRFPDGFSKFRGSLLSAGQVRR